MFEIVDVNELIKKHPDLTKKDLAAYFNDCFKMIKKDLKLKKIFNVYDGDYPDEEIFYNDINENKTLIAMYRDAIIGAISYEKFGLENEFLDDENHEKYLTFLKQIDVDPNNYYSLHRLFVLPEYQGKGAGTYLLKYVENLLKNTTIVFLVSPYNIPALKMYENLGYLNLGNYTFFFGDFVVFKKEN